MRVLRYADVHRLISVAQALRGIIDSANDHPDVEHWEHGYERDPDYFDGWKVDCPNCGGHRTLRMHLQVAEEMEVHELEELGDDEWLRKAVLIVGCSRRCAIPDELIELLDQDSEAIAKRVGRLIRIEQAARIVELERELKLAQMHLAREQEIADRLARTLVTDGRISSPL